MASELEHFLADQLAHLPENHPDRAFLTAQKALTDAFLDRRVPTINSTDRALSEDLAEAPPAGVLPESAAPTASTDLYLAGDSSEPVTVADVVQTEQAERERVVLKGRIGKRVRYSTTPRGVRRAEFNLATAVDEETTAWHTILAFRDRAERLEQANPQKGQYLEVIGYRDTIDRKDNHGNAKQVERIIAAHIRLR
jgi:hypothetical protein